MFSAFNELSDAVKVAIISGGLAMITGIIVAIINKERKKKAKEQPPAGSVTAIQKGNINMGTGAGAVVGRDQNISEHNKKD